MTEDQLALLIKQHVDLLSEIQKLWVAFTVIVVLGLIFLVAMLLAAAWSVYVVNKRQTGNVVGIKEGQAALEGKFSLLIDVLLETEKNRRERSKSV